MPIGPEVVAYKVKKEDSLWNIVKTAGFPAKDWKKIYKARYNNKFADKLKQENRSPDKIFPGEIIYLPKYNSKAIMAHFQELQTLKKIVSNSTQKMNVIQKSLSDLKGMKDEKHATLSKKIDALTSEIDRIKTATAAGTGGPRGWTGPRDRWQKTWSRTYIRHSEGMYDMEREVGVLIKHKNNGVFVKAIKNVEKLAKAEQKNLNEAYSSLIEGEKLLKKMLKSPYK